MDDITILSKDIEGLKDTNDKIQKDINFCLFEKQRALVRTNHL